MSIIFNVDIALPEDTQISTEKMEETQTLQEEIRWLQAEAVVTIATRHETPISKTPGIVSVITAKQIKQMGFRTLSDVVKTVPGFDVSMDMMGTKQINIRLSI